MTPNDLPPIPPLDLPPIPPLDLGELPELPHVVSDYWPHRTELEQLRTKCECLETENKLQGNWLVGVRRELLEAKQATRRAHVVTGRLAQQCTDLTQAVGVALRRLAAGQVEIAREVLELAATNASAVPPEPGSSAEVMPQVITHHE